MLISWSIEAICPLLKAGEQVVLATIVSKSGSAPCLAGSKMVVRADGSFNGTIGGGALEAQGLERAREVFRSGVSQYFSVDLSGKDAASMHMICGGRVDVLLELIAPDQSSIAVFDAVREALQRNERCTLISWLGSEVDGLKPIERCLVGHDQSLTGVFLHPRAWLAELAQLSHSSAYPVLTVIEEQRFLVERCYVPSTVYLFGAGHVSQHVADFAVKMEFQVVVLDDREEFACRERFPTVDEVQVVASFEECMNGLEIDRDSYLVIVTRGHTHDKTVLTQALQTPAGYIGMLGSRKKSVEIRRALLEEGFPEERVNSIHCPIGLKIGAQSTAEIAVSIVAELIQARSERER